MNEPAKPDLSKLRRPSMTDLVLIVRSAIVLALALSAGAIISWLVWVLESMLGRGSIGTGGYIEGAARGLVATVLGQPVEYPVYFVGLMAVLATCLWGLSLSAPRVATIIRKASR